MSGGRWGGGGGGGGVNYKHWLSRVVYSAYRVWTSGVKGSNLRSQLDDEVIHKQGIGLGTRLVIAWPLGIAYPYTTDISSYHGQNFMCSVNRKSSKGTNTQTSHKMILSAKGHRGHTLLLIDVTITHKLKLLDHQVL